MRKKLILLLIAIMLLLLVVVFATFEIIEKSPLSAASESVYSLAWHTSLWPQGRSEDPPPESLRIEDFGQSVAVGDLNGDGFDEVVVCSALWVDVYEGPLPEQDGWIWADPMLEIGPMYSSEYFGDVAVADVNGDDIMDLIIGSYKSFEPHNGWVSAFYGRTTWTTSYPILQFYIDEADWRAASPANSPSGSGGGKFGFSVANAGDTNADGIDDIIVGAPREEEGKGKAYVYYGSSTGLPADQEPDAIIPPYGEWWLEQLVEENFVRCNLEGVLGTDVAKDGIVVGDTWTADGLIIGIPAADIDLDGDGYFDATETNIGIALLGPRWWALSGDNEYRTQFGYVLGNAGDVNGDGYPEVLVCARKWVVQPKIFLYLGDSDRVDTRNYAWSVENIPFAQIDNAIAAAKPSVGNAKDINGDDFGEILIGDPSYNPDETLGKDGRVHIWFGGPPSTENPSGLLQDPTPEACDIILDPSYIDNDYIQWMCTSFGYSVASGDINGDGLSDIVVGDPDAFHPFGGTEPGVRTGAVHVFLSTFIRPPFSNVGFDFGTPTSPVAPGYIRVTESTAYYPSLGFGWSLGYGNFEFTPTQGLASVDSEYVANHLQRDFVTATGEYPFNYTFNVNLVNGVYRVKLTIGDYTLEHDEIDICANDEWPITDLTVVAGDFRTLSFTTTVSDGILSIWFLDKDAQFNSDGTDTNWVINAIEIEPT